MSDEEITPGPQKEGETRTTTVALTNQLYYKSVKFLETGFIENTFHPEGQYISNIYIRPKKDGSYRLVLNLKYLNVEYHHFKMENLKSAIICVSPNCYMASIDLKDAYYFVCKNLSQRKYLRFKWKTQLYQFTCLPN